MTFADRQAKGTYSIFALVNVMLDGKSDWSIVSGLGISQGFPSLLFVNSPNTEVCFCRMSSTVASDSFWMPRRKVHWSGYGWKFSSTNTLLPFLRACPCNGKATRFPNPPSGKVSWFGKNLSYDLKDRYTSLFMASDRIDFPSRLALMAAMAVSKNTHTCAPLPERDRSI